MSPTRELAQQIDQAMQGFGYYLDGISSVAVYGGNDGNRFDVETKGLKMGADVIIATPGRLLSHIRMGHLDLSKLSFFVLDEADRMLDMGFSDDIISIAKMLPQNHQTIMFSATMPAKIQQLARTLLDHPAEVKIAVSKPAEKIQQSAYLCYEPQKLGIIRSLFKAGELQRVIIFSGKKDKVKDITRELKHMKINCASMHSDLSQAERDEVMYRFKAGQVDVLVATDIVSRGIDIDDILMVINYDVPHDAEDYVHRIGRTARAQRDGVAITFVSEADMRSFADIERFLEKDIQKNPLPAGLGEGPEYKTSAPRKNSRGRGGRKRGGKSHTGTPQQPTAKNSTNGKSHKRRRSHKPKSDV
jgi:superfamily II DNA/RNA helicase